MKHVTQALIALFLLVSAACGNEAPTPPAEVPDGLRFETLDDTFAAGTYKVEDTAIRFEAIVAGGVETMRVLDLDGHELFRSEIVGNTNVDLGERPTNWAMWHYGVPVDLSKPREAHPEVERWMNSQEAQLVASMWRDIVAQYSYEAGPLNALFRYGVHLEEAIAFEQEGIEDRQEANCDCYGKCGPGCFSVGSASYCRKHDCCCRTYGGWACATWCLWNPKCPAPICG